MLLLSAIIAQQSSQFYQIAKGVAAKEARAKGNWLGFYDGYASFFQLTSIPLQIINHQTHMLIVFSGTINSGNEMQFHLAWTCNEPDELELRQGLGRLLFLQTKKMAVKCAYSFLCARRHKERNMLQSGFDHGGSYSFISKSSQTASDIAGSS